MLLLKISRDKAVMGWGVAFKERQELSREGCVMWGRKEWHSRGGSGTCRSQERGKKGERESKQEGKGGCRALGGF